VLTIKEIDRSNWLECVDLKHDDHRFVGSAEFVLADAYVSRDYMTAYGIYAENTMVGVVLVRNKPENEAYAFSEFFIADDHLRKGYGREAVLLLLRKLKLDGFKKINICVDKENNIALKFFEKCGFSKIGAASWNENYLDLIFDDLEKG
jgi:RimJ/RimL family protein N-acetyltransferase